MDLLGYEPGDPTQRPKPLGVHAINVGAPILLEELQARERASRQGGLAERDQ